MRPRSWTRSILKWGLSAGCAVCSVLWLISGTWAVQLKTDIGNGVCFVSGWCNIDWGMTHRLAEILRKDLHCEGFGGVEVFKPRFAHVEWRWYPLYLSTSCVDVPGWYPVVAMGVPAALLWYLDRRRIPPGHCQKCGYNLTGNISGRCPECATPVPSPETPAPDRR